MAAMHKHNLLFLCSPKIEEKISVENNLARHCEKSALNEELLISNLDKSNEN